MHRRSQVGVDRAGQAEVEDLRLSRRIDEDVRRLQIAMDDALLVRVLDGVADLREQLSRSASDSFRRATSSFSGRPRTSSIAKNGWTPCPVSATPAS